MLASSVIVACLIHLNENNSNANMSMATIIFVLIFVIFFQFGVGPIPPFITSELFVASQRFEFVYQEMKINFDLKITRVFNHSFCQLDFKYDNRRSLSISQWSYRRIKFSYFRFNHLSCNNLCPFLCAGNKRKNNNWDKTIFSRSWINKSHSTKVIYLSDFQKFKKETSVNTYIIEAIFLWKSNRKMISVWTFSNFQPLSPYLSLVRVSVNSSNVYKCGNSLCEPLLLLKTVNSVFKNFNR